MSTLEHAEAWEAAHRFTAAFPSGSPVLAWPGTLDDEPLKTRTTYGAWVLPSGEAVVRVVGHPAGIALTHIQHDPTRQPAVPDVEFLMPPCPICEEGLDSDGDSLICHRCHATWNSDGTRGEWQDGSADRCKATARPYVSIATDDVEACLLHLGHDTDDDPAKAMHQTQWTSWTDRDPRAITDAEGEQLRRSIDPRPAPTGASR